MFSTATMVPRKCLNITLFCTCPPPLSLALFFNAQIGIHLLLA